MKRLRDFSKSGLPLKGGIKAIYYFKAALMSLFLGCGLFSCTFNQGTVNLGSLDALPSLPPIPISYFMVAVDPGANVLKIFPIGSDEKLGTAKTKAVTSLGNHVAGSPTANFVFAISNGGNTISSYSIAADGTLTELTGSPTANSGQYKEHLEVEPHGRYLYSFQSGTGIVEAYKIDSSSGALTAISGNVAATNTSGIACITFSKTGKYLYAAAQGQNPGDSAVYAFAIDQVTGALTNVAGSPYIINGRGSYGIAISSDEKYVITSDTGNTWNVGTGLNGASAFSVNSSTGALSFINSYTDASFYGLQMTADAYGRVYMASSSGAQFATIVQNLSGAITGISVLGAGNAGVAVDPTGKFIYSATSTTIGQYSIGSGGGAVTSLSPSTVGSFTNAFGLSLVTFR